MTNEISQNMLGAIVSQPRRESGATSRVRSTQVEATSVTAGSVYKRSDVSSASEPATAAVKGKQLAEMVEHLNGITQSIQRQLQFSVDDENGKVYVKVLDAETKDVIREIPSEEIRNMQKQLKEMSDELFLKGEGVSLLFRGEA